MKQCEELALYGDDQFEMWFDGANGGDGYYGGANETRSIDRETYYDVPNLRDYVHDICKDCVMWGVGGEARWIGNEEGWAGQTNWSPENRGIAGENNGMYGSEDGWFWLPGESDAKSTSGGWFWHSGQSYTSAERLFQMYLETVGRNSTLILNIPPDQSGLLPQRSVDILKQLGDMITSRLGNDLARSAKSVEVTAVRDNGQARTYAASNLTDGDKDTYWATNDGVNTAQITITWDSPQTLRYVALMEYIIKGQRVKGFTIETSADGVTWAPRADGIEKTTIGYKRIVPLNGSTASSYGSGVTAKALRISITDSRACPLLHTISVY